MVTDLLDDEALLDLRRRAKATDPAAVLEEERRRRAAAAWPTAAAHPGAAAPAAAAPAAMAGTGTADAAACALCGTRRARDRCTMCGRPACAADLWVMLRLCRACADERAVERGQRGSRPEAANWLTGPGAGAGGAGGRP